MNKIRKYENTFNSHTKLLREIILASYGIFYFLNLILIINFLFSFDLSTAGIDYWPFLMVGIFISISIRISINDQSLKKQQILVSFGFDISPLPLTSLTLPKSNYFNLLRSFNAAYLILTAHRIEAGHKIVFCNATKWISSLLPS